MVAPNLPNHLSKLFHNSIFQVVLFGIITFVASKDITISILLTISFFISFHSYTRYLHEQVNQTKKYINDIKNGLISIR